MEGGFRKYQCRKVVEARPMSMGEAYAAKLLHAGVEVFAEDGGCPGYEVVYEDGYRSWSPAAVFNAGYRCIETYVDRMYAEKEELDVRIERLHAWLTGGVATEDLSEKVWALLELQSARMMEYSKVLDTRLSLGTTGSLGRLTWGFGAAVLWLKNRHVVHRRSWPEGRVVVKQIPRIIDGDAIASMTSLPDSAKSLLGYGADEICERDQLLVIDYQTGITDSWSPSVEDVFAEDWELVLPDVKKSSEDVAK